MKWTREMKGQAKRLFSFKLLHINQKNNRKTRRAFHSMTERSETFKWLEGDPQGGSQYLTELLESFLMPF